MIRSGTVGPWLGIPVVVNDYLPDGTMVMVGRSAVIIGAFPRTEVELARYRARWLVQQGLLDVLHWLGEKPIPEHPPTAASVLAAMRQNITLKPASDYLWREGYKSA